jgi:Spy/CpxP family protein refolding chaperone
MYRDRKQILAIALISAGISGAAIIPNNIISAQSSIPKASAVVTPQNQKSEQNPINLTDAQKQQFKTLNEQTSQLIQDVLTPEQQAIFTTELKKGDRNAAWKAIKLSRE